MKLILLSSPHPIQGEEKLLKQMFDAGLEYFHLRKPHASIAELKDFLLEIPPRHLDKIIIHQHYTLAEEFKIKGIHLPEKIRQSGHFSSAQPPISTSFHRLEDIKTKNQPYEYAFLSPIFDSISKQGYKAAFQHEDLKKALPKKAVKVVALGGISPNNILMVKGLGFDGAAVLGAVWQSIDPVKAFEDIRLKC